MYGVFMLFSYVASISVIGAGFLYCYDKDKFDELSTALSWNTVKYYHKANIEMRKFLKPDAENKKKDKEIKNEKLEPKFWFVGYCEKEDSTFTCNLNELNKKKYYIDDTNFDLIFIKKELINGEEKWKRITKDLLNDVTQLKEFITIDKPFLQIEYSYKLSDSLPVEKTEIHGNMIPFYLKDNIILDKVFIKWFVKKYFGQIPNETYELQIIDSHISIFKMNQEQSCLLLQDKYEINN